MNKFLFYLSLPFRPMFWLSNQKVNRGWDTILSQLLDERAPITIDETGCVADIDGYPVWIQNYPYAYGKIWFGDGKQKGTEHAQDGKRKLPTLYTRYRLDRRMKEEFGENYERDLYNRGLRNTKELLERLKREVDDRQEEL